MLVLDVLLSHTAAFVMGGVLLLLGVVLWVVVPLAKKRQPGLAD